MKDCIFCKIARNEIPSERLYENEDLVAVRDIHPAAPTHVLIITKTHVATLNDVGGVQDRTLASLLRAAKEIAAREGIADDGYRVVINCNRAGGQEVFHLHAHVLGGRTMGKMG